MGKPTVGGPAPDFSLTQDDGRPVSLQDFRGRKVVVYFYPKADTPGCTRESQAFSALAEEFARADTAVLGVSADPPKAQAAFKRKYGLAHPLASDESRTAIAAFGAWGEKSFYGRKSMGVLRTTFLIDRDGRIARIWPKVRVDGHAQEVLQAAHQL